MTDRAGEEAERAPGGEPAAADEVPPEEDRWPIGFILTIVMAGLYLAYRLWQGLVLFWRWAF